MKGATQGPAGQQLKGRATGLSGSSERSCCRSAAGGDPPERKKGPGTREKRGQGSWCAKEKATDPSARTRAQVSKQCTEIRGQGKRGNLLKTHTVRREKCSVAMGETGRRRGREQGHTQRERGGLEQEGEESFDAWREMQHKGNRGTNNLRGFHHLRLN